jgi:hypothetical protein
MPAAKKRKTIQRSKTTVAKPKKGTKYKNKVHVVAIPRSCIGMPENLIISLRYVFTAQFAERTADGEAMFQNIKINSIHDPDGQLGGGQPWVSDELRAMYNRYFVEDASVSVEWQPFQVRGSDMKLIRGGLFYSDGTGSSTTNTPMEIKAQGQGTQSVIPAETGKRHFLKWSAKEYFKENFIAANNQDTSPTNSDPSHTAYVNVWSSSVEPDVSVLTPAHSCLITVQQRVRFSARSLSTEG